MARLIATSPCAGLLPRTIGSATLSEIDAGKITLVAPFKGQVAAVSKALEPLGLTFPNPNRMIGSSPRALWCGMDQALVMGAGVPDMPAACVDHSDAWAIVQIEGVASRDVLARLTPVDLRPTLFQIGHTARTLIAHMTASVTRTRENTYEIMVMRSMAGTLVHDLSQAATGVARR